ncbi:hypothetical protein NO1_0464 [Candidatus Termititenax aidoneus]|uniref:Uncharacterized protein n=1 Tax=Termititenax aidoneus TaxID=2218524 RepID=A0A388T9U8_TERA1|nr:hypothetical protein NO1_0464 [Candidatus Termititenax aidoneus]
MSKFTVVEEEALGKISAELRLTYSQRRISWTYIYEITRRENISVNEVLTSADQTNRKNFLQSLFKRRFPEASALIKAGEWQPCGRK